MCFRDKQRILVSMWNLALQPLKTLQLHYLNAYVHQDWQCGHLTWGAFIHKVIWPSHHMVFRDHVKAKSYYIFTTRVPIAIKLGKMVTYLEGLLPIKSHGPFITWSWEITWKKKHISTTTVPMATKHGSVTTYLEGLLSTKSHGS